MVLLSLCILSESNRALMLQVRETAAKAGVSLGGENALPCFSPLHIDSTALERVVYNSSAWGPPLQVCACFCIVNTGVKA